MSIPNKSHAVQNPLRALFDGFAGSEIFIPSVQTLCPDWPLRRHPDLEYIRNDFTSWVNRSVVFMYRLKPEPRRHQSDILLLSAVRGLLLLPMTQRITVGFLLNTSQLVQRSTPAKEDRGSWCPSVRCYGISGDRSRAALDSGQIHSMGIITLLTVCNFTDCWRDVVFPMGWWYLGAFYMACWAELRSDLAIDDGSLSHKPGQINRYKDETIALIEQCLCSTLPQEIPHPNPAIQSFWDLGVEIRQKGTPGASNLSTLDTTH